MFIKTQIPSTFFFIFFILANKDIYANVAVQGHASVSTLTEDSVQIMALALLPKKPDVYELMLR